MMNQGIGSILDSVNRALLQYVEGEQVRPVMQQISQLLSPFDQRQSPLGFGQQGTIPPGFGQQGAIPPGFGQGLGMQGGSLLNMSPAFQNAAQNKLTSNSPNLSLTDMAAAGRPTPQYMPMDQGNGMDQFGRPFAENTFNASPSGIGSFLSGMSNL